MKWIFKKDAKPQWGVGAKVGVIGAAVASLLAGWWVWSDDLGGQRTGATPQASEPVGRATSPFGEGQALPDAAVPVAAGASAPRPPPAPPWDQADLQRGVQPGLAPPPGMDVQRFEQFQTHAAYLRYKEKFIQTLASGQEISAEQFKRMAQATELQRQAGYLTLLDYYAANEVLLRKQYPEGAALDQQLDQLVRKVDALNQELKNQTIPADEAFKAYKQKELAIIKEAGQMKTFPNGMSKEDYILKQVEAIPR